MTTWYREHRAWLVLAGLLSLYLLLACSSAAHKSVTVDEFAHLPAGVNLLRTLDSAYATHNPPLANTLNALPAVALGAPASPPSSGVDFWANGYILMAALSAPGEYHRVFVAARMITIALVGALAVLLFVWARALAPQRRDMVGPVVAALVLLSPNILAHSRLVTTDAAAACTMTLALYAVHRAVHRPGWVGAALAGLALGLALMTKFTAVLLLPTAVLSLGLWQPAAARPWSRRIAEVALMLAMAWALVVVGYGVQGVGTPLGQLELDSDVLGATQRVLPAWCPVPVPEHWLLAYDRQAADVALGDTSYLLGESYFGGRWYYFLVLGVAKLPVPTLLLAGLAMVWSLRAGRRDLDLAWLLLVPAALAFGVLSLLSEKQLGIRMLLPVAPAVLLWCVVALGRGPWPRGLRLGVLLLTGWIALESIRVWPHYLSYFSPLVGGRDDAHLVAVDSNLDWGQDLPALRSTLDELAPGEPVQLMYFGRVDPALYLGDHDYIVPVNRPLQPGYLAVSTTLMGRPYLLYDHGAMLYLAEAVSLDEMGLGEPLERVGKSIYLYRVP